jgi:hypothetical protein
MVFRKTEGMRLLGIPKHRWEDILKWVLDKSDESAWTGFISLRIWTSGWLLLARLGNY